MSDTKLSPKTACMHLDTLSLNEQMPVINLYIEEEKVSQNEHIVVFKKEKKKSSLELF